MFKFYFPPIVCRMEDDEVISVEPLIGELAGMCSEAEARLRTETRQIDRFEQAANGAIDLSKAVKKYQRSSADKKYYAHETRTIDACWNTVDYLITSLLDFDVNPKPGYAELCYSASFFEIYSFLRDRLRAVRVDLHVQNALTNPIFIRIHEICLRFELVSLFLLWGRHFGSSDDRKFDVHLSLTALSQTIDPLSNAYAKRRESDPNHDIETEAEITSYVLLLALTSRGGSKTFKSHYLKQPAVIKQHEKVVEAYNVVCDFYSGNSISFLSKFKSLPFLASCCLLPVVNTARTRALWRMVRTNRPFFIRKDPSAGPMPAPRPERISMTRMMDSLAFSNRNECESFLRFCGLVIDGNDCCIPPRQLTKNPVTWWTSSAEWRAQANDQRPFQDYEWSVDLLDAFHKSIGEDVGDEAPPDRSDYPMTVDGGLVSKYESSGSRRAIILGEKDTPVFKPVVQIPQVVNPPIAPTPTFFPGPISMPPKPERPIVPLEPLEVPKRPRDSPEKVVNIFAPVEKPPQKKLHEEPIPEPSVVALPSVVVQPPKPMPTLPSVQSPFELLAAELGRVSIAHPTAPTVMDHSLVEEQADVERGREISRRRLRYVALKCLRAWRDSNAQSHRWRWLLGSTSRAPARINP